MDNFGQNDVAKVLAKHFSFRIGLLLSQAIEIANSVSSAICFPFRQSWTERLSPRAPGSEVGGELGVSFRSVGMRLPAGTSIKETTMSPLRARMIEDMTLAGLAVGTQKIYIQAVRRLAAHCRRSPDELGEEEVRRYLL